MDEGFMRQWREARLRELQNVGERIRSRTNSPSRRIYGGMPLVDGEGYLDAVDKTASGTVVVVFIYDANVSKHEAATYFTLTNVYIVRHQPRSRRVHAPRRQTQRHRPLCQDAWRRR
jgi:hypothetical protein